MSDDRPQGHPRDSDDDRATGQDDGYAERRSRAVPLSADDGAGDDASAAENGDAAGNGEDRDAITPEEQRDAVESTRDYTAAADAAPKVPTAEPPLLNADADADADADVDSDAEAEWPGGRPVDDRYGSEHEPTDDTIARPVTTTVTEHPVTSPTETIATSRPDDTRPDDTRPDDTRPDDTRHDDDIRHDDGPRHDDDGRDATAAYPAAPVSAASAAAAVAPGPTPAATGPASGPADATAYTPAPAQPQSPAPIYVQAPVTPKKKGNRGIGILIAFVATIVFGLLYALGTATLASITSPDAFGAPLVRYLSTPVFWGPVVVFFLAFALLIAIVNRANWWAYVLGGFPVAVIVYAAYIGARLIQQDITQLTPSEAALVVQRVSTFPDGILAAVLAREIVIWAGAAISARGRSVKARNTEARAEYERTLAGTPGA